MLGGKTRKIIYSFIFRNQFTKCSCLKLLCEHISKLAGETNKENIKTSKDEIDRLAKHTFLKNFDGPPKSMETKAIVEAIFLAPENLKLHIRVICMDNYTVPRA